ncbi:hypothetical protein [Arenibacter palladensis]|uniref:hypothetical protein n=1 Tax=Arenibacter palladensis TaxID=237373 RepID=UPI0026E137A6|nr:hypothetical protein [Arenibacter palladensis]MDO6605322.1 hypothetical protein [Arenibacter palladensis]
MKNNNIQIVLQIIALVFLFILFYTTFTFNSNWKVIEDELKNARMELNISKDTILKIRKSIKTTSFELEKLKLQKSLVTQQRDSFLLEFKKQNSVDWDHRIAFKDSLDAVNKRIKEDEILLKKLFGQSK